MGNNDEISFNMWVFRMSRGWEGGEPTGQCPITEEGIIDPLKLISSIEKTTPLDYAKIHRTKSNNFMSCDEYLEMELFRYGRLRQGWGFPGLNIKLPEKEWIENWIKGCWRYWNTKVDCGSAIGRLRILKHMEQMQTGDIIFIPNIPNGKFTIAKVRNRYKFEDNSNKPDTWLKDFGHVINVGSLKSYDYDIWPFKKNIFSAPYYHAIDPIKREYESYYIFLEFIIKFYSNKVISL